MDRAGSHTAQALAGINDVFFGLHGDDIPHRVLMVPLLNGLS